MAIFEGLGRHSAGLACSELAFRCRHSEIGARLIDDRFWPVPTRRDRTFPAKAICQQNRYDRLCVVLIYLLE